MARRVVGRFPALRQGQRRTTEWGASADATAVQNLAAATVVLDQIASSASLEAQGLLPSTIIRTRGVLYTKADTIAAAEQAFGAISMAVTDDNAAAAGVASLQAPIANEDSDTFFLYEQFFAGGITDTAGFKAPWYVQTFDSKAMRKVEPGQAIVVVLENASASHGIQYIVKFRQLYKLT